MYFFQIFRVSFITFIYRVRRRQYSVNIALPIIFLIVIRTINIAFTIKESYQLLKFALLVAIMRTFKPKHRCLPLYLQTIKFILVWRLNIADYLSIPTSPIHRAWNTLISVRKKRRKSSKCLYRAKRRSQGRTPKRTIGVTVNLLRRMTNSDL